MKAALGGRWLMLAFAVICAIAVAEWFVFHLWWMPVVAIGGFGIGVALAEWKARRRDRRGE